MVEMVENEKIVKKYCKRCHRELKDEKSKELGYGKICYNKIKLLNKNYLFEFKE